MNPKDERVAILESESAPDRKFWDVLVSGPSQKSIRQRISVWCVGQAAPDCTLTASAIICDV
jgi:hypothetical protein